ncbi:hypothetical protein AQUCO_09100050v1 [Aquilegia coerulea]|uniref:RanBP2-type domain-containing protein n=1 Tax=Aquilegia coerulea TaxID=218851 RepID=A0A2G5C5P8_AQUCA|nr:hypothetical protein AQUCO_09100050v1 [Aquilegia coerulea]
MHQQLFSKSQNFLLLLRIFKNPAIYISSTSHFHSSNQNPISQANFAEELQSLKPPISSEGKEPKENLSLDNHKLQISHPWPEWVQLMEHLVKKGYFQDGIGHPFSRGELGNKDTNQIRTALLNFARDRFDLIRDISRKDIAVILGSGCPSIDRKVVNSGKRLRAHVGIEEGKVCSSCSLRGSCERAYVKAREDEGGRTVDVIRILLTYGLDPITSSVENTPCLNRKVKESVRSLLSEMVEFSIRKLEPDSSVEVPSKRHSFLPEHSCQPHKGQMDIPMKQGDWICPKCNFLNFARNIKCLRCDGLFEERLRKLGEGQDHLPLKKGDWLCDKCNFLNFAKNTRCLQCQAKPPKRPLSPGEWECDSCNYINFKRNMVCLKCDWKRPKASNYSDTSSQNQAQYENSKQGYGMNFVRDDECNGSPSFRQERRKESARAWTNVEDNNDNGLRPWNRFENFPVADGKSDISQNPQARERWKEEMSKRSHNFCYEDDDDDDLDCQLPLDSIDPTDDEEIAEWFGGKKRGEWIGYKNED